jgi:hypothetical protein
MQVISLRWWHYGLFGGVVLSLATVVKAIGALLWGAFGRANWAEFPRFLAAVFAMGFVCGLVVWVGRGLSRRLGVAGDAVLGMIVMEVFFICCMFLFDPDLLGRKLSYGGLPMLGGGAVLGLLAGALIGRDVRRQWPRSDRGQHRGADPPGTKPTWPEQ